MTVGIVCPLPFNSAVEMLTTTPVWPCMTCSWNTETTWAGFCSCWVKFLLYWNLQRKKKMAVISVHVNNQLIHLPLRVVDHNKDNNFFKTTLILVWCIHVHVFIIWDIYQNCNNLSQTTLYSYFIFTKDFNYIFKYQIAWLHAQKRKIHQK